MRVLSCLLVVWVAMATSAAGQDRLLLQAQDGEPGPIELFVQHPDGRGPWPVILFVHGHQFPDQPGGRVFAEPVGPAGLGRSRLRRMADRGYLAAAVSQPGYGGSAGPPDFCGPRTQTAIHRALDHLLAHRAADPARVVVFGVSRGAIAASMVATRDTRITALVLVAGLYDLGEAYPTGDPGLDANIAQEAGTTPDAVAARSALRHADGIGAATLILHGEADTQGRSADQARRLATALRANGTPARLHLHADTGHRIPIAAIWQQVDAFLVDVIGR